MRGAAALVLRSKHRSSQPNRLTAPVTLHRPQHPPPSSSSRAAAGYYRDGFCRTGGGDVGVHVVCARVTAEFLAYTASRGNDLSTPSPWFPGLNPGDQWCLCAAR